MLIELGIQNLGVIADAQLPFAPGFTVLTGETGAGKTMVLNALALLMGGKNNPKLIRQGCESLAIEGSWDVSGWPDVQALVQQVGGEIDDDGSVIGSRLATAARSKALLGGRVVPQATMAQFTGALATVHGQADQVRLRTPSRQRAALDEYGRSAQPHYAEVLSRYQELWESQAILQAQYETLTNAAAQRSREAELLRLSLTDIERVAPLSGEQTELASQAARLTNVESLRLAAGQAHDAMVGSELPDGDAASATLLIETARRALVQAATDDATLTPLAERAAEVGYLVADLATELASYLTGLDADPEQLEIVQARLSELNGLARRLGMSLDAIPEWADAAAKRLLELDNDENAITTIETQLAAVRVELLAAAGALTVARQQAATSLATAASAELAGLGMKDAELLISLAKVELGAAGQDLVEFQLLPHRGAPPSSLSKGVSGGELSRVMLALELTLAATNSSNKELQLPTFVFDEVDAGVGGKAAVEVGRRLARLAQLTQVIVITHLPQVAAFADQHLVVEKLGGDTSVTVISGADREREIARMLSGSEGSATALSHARELLGSA